MERVYEIGQCSCQKYVSSSPPPPRRIRLTGRNKFCTFADVLPFSVYFRVCVDKTGKDTPIEIMQELRELKVSSSGFALGVLVLMSF